MTAFPLSFFLFFSQKWRSNPEKKEVKWCNLLHYKDRNIVFVICALDVFFCFCSEKGAPQKEPERSKKHKKRGKGRTRDLILTLVVIFNRVVTFFHLFSSVVTPPTTTKTPRTTIIPLLLNLFAITRARAERERESVCVCVCVCVRERERRSLSE